MFGEHTAGNQCVEVGAFLQDFKVGGVKETGYVAKAHGMLEAKFHDNGKQCDLHGGEVETAAEIVHGHLDVFKVGVAECRVFGEPENGLHSVQQIGGFRNVLHFLVGKRKVVSFVNHMASGFTFRCAIIYPNYVPDKILTFVFKSHPRIRGRL